VYRLLHPAKEHMNGRSQGFCTLEVRLLVDSFLHFKLFVFLFSSQGVQLFSSLILTKRGAVYFKMELVFMLLHGDDEDKSSSYKSANSLMDATLSVSDECCVYNELESSSLDSEQHPL